MKNSHTFSDVQAGSETQAVSPFKKYTTSINKKFQLTKSQITTQGQTAIHSKKLSRTEQQIYSHELIGSVMSKRHNNSVMHSVGHFDPDIQLYAKPKNPEQYGMLQFSDQRKMYQSQYTKKIIDINRKLNHEKSLSERVKNRKQETSATFYRTKRPVSAQPRQASNVHKKISVSGLVSYNFNSVNARKNLGYDLQRDDDKLNLVMQKLQIRNKCCNNRHSFLIQKKKLAQAKHEKQIKQAIFSDFETATGCFLSNLHEQISEEKIIYGAKWGKLLCIKQLMQQQKISYSEAESIVNQIEQKKQLIKGKQKVKQLDRNQQSELNNRRQISQKSRVMVKQLYFVD